MTHVTMGSALLGTIVVFDRAANSGPPLTEQSGLKSPDGTSTERAIP